MTRKRSDSYETEKCQELTPSQTACRGQEGEEPDLIINWSISIFKVHTVTLSEIFSEFVRTSFLFEGFGQRVNTN